jgi:hypothetical protein
VHRQLRLCTNDDYGATLLQATSDHGNGNACNEDDGSGGDAALKALNDGDGDRLG